MELERLWSASSARVAKGGDSIKGIQGIYLAPNYNDSMKRRRSLAIVDEELARRPRMRSQTGGFGPSIKYVTLFLANFYPPPSCHTLSHISDPPPIFRRLSTNPRTKAPCTNSVSIVRGGFCPGVLSEGLFMSGRFCPGGFCPSPFCQNTSVTSES